MTRHGIAGLLFAGIFAFGAAHAQPKDKPAKGKPADKAVQKAGDKGKGGGAPQMSADQQKMMEMMAKLAQPGEQHKQLASMDGKWDAAVRSWMSPGQPTESKGSCEYKMVMGGRYQVQDFKGNMMGQEFQGHGITGYDNAKKKYFSVWFDSMSTGVMTMEGTGDGKTIEMTGSFTDEQGKPATARTITRIESDKKHVFEMWGKGPDGKDMKMMEIVYTKK